MASTSPFHLAFTVRDISETRAFFGGLLGCTEGFVSETRVDFDFFGNHLVAHLRRDAAPVAGSIQTDEQRIPLPHFGVILDLAAWETLAAAPASCGAGACAVGSDILALLRGCASVPGLSLRTGLPGPGPIPALLPRGSDLAGWRRRTGANPPLRSPRALARDRRGGPGTCGLAEG